MNIRIWVVLVIFTFFCSTLYAKTYGEILCKDSQFFCYKVKRADTWEILFPDPEQKNIVMRLNRMNIQLHSGMNIAIPNNLNGINLLDLSPFPKQINPPGEKIILVTLKSLAWGAYNEQGTLQQWGPASGGKGWCPDIHRSCHTATGNFTIYEKRGAKCFSTKYPVPRGGAPMPYCMFFHNGFALHGSYDVPGFNASHGCVRIFIDDAKWLNEQFIMDQPNIPVVISPL